MTLDEFKQYCSHADTKLVIQLAVWWVGAIGWLVSGWVGINENLEETSIFADVETGYSFPTHLARH